MKITTQNFLRILTVTVLLISVNFNISSQNRFGKDDLQGKLRLSHPLNHHPAPLKDDYYNNAMFRSLVPETLTVYAVRVQFKPDNNNQTTGDGRFDLSNDYPDSVDAPAHDSAYFAYKLEFLKNYYFKVSKGQLVIN